jgi:hypothetical protein
MELQLHYKLHYINIKFVQLLQKPTCGDAKAESIVNKSISIMQN